MGWFVVLLVALALGVALFSGRSWLRERLDPTLAEVRLAAAEARGLEVRAWVRPGDDVAGWTPGVPHLELTDAPVSLFARAAGQARVILVSTAVAPFESVLSEVPSGRVLLVELPAISWSLGAVAREIPPGEGVVFVDLRDGPPGDIVGQACAAARRRGVPVVIAASGPHEAALVAAFAQAGHADRVRRG